MYAANDSIPLQHVRAICGRHSRSISYVHSTTDAASVLTAFLDTDTCGGAKTLALKTDWASARLDASSHHIVRRQTSLTIQCGVWQRWQAEKGRCVCELRPKFTLPSPVLRVCP